MTNFVLDALNADAVMGVGALLHTSAVPTERVAQRTINHTIDIATANRLFLFKSDDSLTDLSDDVADDLRFATNNLQYAPVYSSTLADRKFVMIDLLKDIFGTSGAESLSNVDIFSNEAALDVDIDARLGSDTVSSHATVLGHVDQGALNIAAGATNLVDLDLANLNTTSVGIDKNSISQTLLEQAANAAQAEGGSSSIFSRQLDAAAVTHSNTVLGAAAKNDGWKCFQFVEDDTIQFTVKLSKVADSLPSWAVVRSNATAGPGQRNDGVDYAALGASGTPTPTIYKFIISVHASNSSYNV